MDKKLSIADLALAGKRVLIRVDFNVPIKDGKVADCTRVDASMPTIKYALEKGASGVVLMSHLGRPDGMRKEKDSMKPLVAELEKRLPGTKVHFANDCVGPEVEAQCRALSGGDVLLLENLRFHHEEEGVGVDADGKKIKSTPEQVEAFRASLSRLADFYVNDAFGTAHRPHSSMVGVNPPRACGFLVKKELDYFAQVLEHPKRPMLAILGGAKVSDKIKLINNLIDRVDEMIICGGMAFTFKKAVEGVDIGASLFDAPGAETAKATVEKARAKGVKLHFPVDYITASKFAADAETGTATDASGIPAGWMGLDAGEQSRKLFADVIARAATILWNGPAGVFEMAPFAAGTIAMGQAVVAATERGAVTVIGGGDSAAAAEKFGFADKVGHVSTGGGASMQLLEGVEPLPGVDALTEKASL